MLSALLDHFKIGKEHILNMANQRLIPREGIVGDDIRYHFHGFGCYAVGKDFEADFDFQPQGTDIIGKRRPRMVYFSF